MILMMSESAYKEASHDFVNKINRLDIELTSKIVGKDVQVDEVYKILNLRLSIFEKAAAMPLIETDKLSLDYKKADIYIELKMFRLKQDLKEQISQLNSQIGKLENQLANLKNRQK
jgi:predicted GNAT family N-acyltransferase